MSISKQDQFKHENTTWERSLDFFKQENSFLKTRLSVVTDSKDDKEFLKLAEYFQNQFLLKDELIRDLKANVNKQKENITLNLKNGEMPKDLFIKQEFLRKELTYLESDFSRLKNEFNQLLTQVLT